MTNAIFLVFTLFVVVVVGGGGNSNIEHLLIPVHSLFKTCLEMMEFTFA